MSRVDIEKTQRFSRSKPEYLAQNLESTLDISVTRTSLRKPLL